jgi:uncharacterized protein YjbI with pentapeptide repeats
MKKTSWLIRTSMAIACLGTLAFIILGAISHWGWASFDKPLYDWMQLLIIPLSLALIAVWFNRIERKNEQAITFDNQQEAVLQSYFDRMSELLIEKKLRESKLGDETRNVARMRTLTTLFQLNTRRKEHMITFLRESGFLTYSSGSNIITLRKADLRKIDLQEVNLSGIDLSEANLSEANLSGANLETANLSKANLSGANLSGANLETANLKEAYIKNANLNSVHLWRADLSHAIINGTNLSDAHIYEANLSDAVLIGANLRGAKLYEAVLRGANLMATDLRGTDFRGADLSGVIIDTMSLAKARISEEQKATLNIHIIIPQHHRSPVSHRSLRKMLLR